MRTQHRDSASDFKCMFAFPKLSIGEVSPGKVLNANPILLRWPVLVCYSLEILTFGIICIYLEDEARMFSEPSEWEVRK